MQRKLKIVASINLSTKEIEIEKKKKEREKKVESLMEQKGKKETKKTQWC